MDDLSIELDATIEAPHEARETIRAHFGDRLPAPTLYDLLTVVTELVSNSVEYGEGETVRVRVSVGPDGQVTGDVENDGEGQVEPRPVDVRTGSGLGLRIVAELVDRWRVFVNDKTRVHFVLRSL